MLTYAQLLGIVVSVVWSSVVTYICLKFVDATMGLRVDESAEIMVFFFAFFLS